MMEWNEKNMKNIYIINIKIPIQIFDNGDKEIFYDNCQYGLEECNEMPPKNECKEIVENIRTILMSVSSSSSSSYSKQQEDEVDFIEKGESDILDIENESSTRSLSPDTYTEPEPEPEPEPDPFAFILKEEIENRPKYHSQNISFKKKPKNIHRYTAKLRI